MKINALIVDDESIVRKGLRFMLPCAAHGIEIIGEAASGEKALEFMEQNTVQLLFTDITMPGMSGLELLKQVNIRFPQVRTVILTCHQDFDYIQEALRLGAIDYMVKTQMEDQELDRLLNRITECFHSVDAQQASKPLTHHEPLEHDLPHITQLWESLQWIMDKAYLDEMISTADRCTASAQNELTGKAITGWQEKCPMLFTHEWVQNRSSLTYHQLTAALRKDKEDISQSLLRSGYSEDVIIAILKSIDYMHSHSGRRLKQEEICEAVTLSKSYLSRSFKDIMGITFVSYLQDTYIRQAKDLLRTTNQPIYRIAETCGFQDEKYFSKVFKTKVGQLPSEYRLARR